MKLITHRDYLKRRIGDYKNWCKRYDRPPGERMEGDHIKRRLSDIILELNKLDHATCTIEELVEAGMPRSWTNLACDECGLDVSAIIEIGEVPDCDTRWQDLCRDCLTKALALFPQPFPSLVT